MSMNNLSKIPTIAESILDHIEKRLKDTNVYEYEDLLNLYSVYGSVLQRALDILEKYPIIETYSTSKKERTLIEIKGEKDQYYRIFPNINFCPCRAFKHQVIEKKIQLTCKHILVGRIACMLGKTTNREVSQEQYLMLVKSIFEFD